VSRPNTVKVKLKHALMIKEMLLILCK